MHSRYIPGPKSRVGELRERGNLPHKFCPFLSQSMDVKRNSHPEFSCFFFPCRLDEAIFLKSLDTLRFLGETRCGSCFSSWQRCSNISQSRWYPFGSCALTSHRHAIFMRLLSPSADITLRHAGNAQELMTLARGNAPWWFNYPFNAN